MSSTTTDQGWKTVVPYATVDRKRGYFLLPTFLPVDDIVWRGASEIVKQYNFSAPANFTLARRPIKPSQGILPGDVGYVLCIKYRVGEIVTRYKLWSDVGEVLNVPLYTGEVIKKNFCLEAWTVANVLEVYQQKTLRITSLYTQPIIDTENLLDYEMCVGEDAGDLSVPVSVINLVDGAVYSGSAPSTYDFMLTVGVTYRIYFGANEIGFEYDMNGTDNINVLAADYVDTYYEFTPTVANAQLTYITASGAGEPVTATISYASAEASVEMPMDFSASAWLDNDESETDEEGDEIDLGLGAPITDAGGDILTDSLGNPLREGT